MSEREGPKVVVRTEVLCTGCKHLKSEYYCIEDGNDCDWGFDHACEHPTIGGRNLGASSPATPEWCPFKGGSE